MAERLGLWGEPGLAGAVTAILRPNGSGKTTLLHVIAGLLSPAAGRIVLAGRRRQEYSRREMSRLLGLVPQDEPVTFDLSVLQYVLPGARPIRGAARSAGAARPLDGVSLQRLLLVRWVVQAPERAA